MASRIEIEEIDTLERLENIRQEWDRLLDASTGATPFQHPEWLIPWWRHLGRGRLMALALRTEGRLSGIAPLYLDDGEVRFLGTGISDYLDLILDDTDGRSCAAAVLNYLASRGGWNALRLEELRPSSTLLTMETPEGLNAERLPGEVCLGVSLPESIDAFRKSHAKSGVCGSQRLRRQLFARGLRIEDAADDHAVRDFLKTLFLLHAKQWESVGESGVLRGRNMIAFHEEAAAGFRKKNMLRLYRLVLEGTHMAAFYGFENRSAFYAYVMGYDPVFSKMSPGNLMLVSVVEECIKNGVARFDFLRGSEKYKYSWNPVETRNTTLKMRKQS